MAHHCRSASRSPQKKSNHVTSVSSADFCVFSRHCGWSYPDRSWLRFCARFCPLGTNPTLKTASWLNPHYHLSSGGVSTRAQNPHWMVMESLSSHLEEVAEGKDREPLLLVIQLK